MDSRSPDPRLPRSFSPRLLALAASFAGCASLALALPALALPAPAAGSSIDWPNFRGPAHGGPAGAGVLPRPQALELVWKKELGAGYSGISAAGGRLVTLHTRGADDLLTAFDAATGDEIWRLRLGEKYAGHDGSDDGPISTPAIADGVVYALGPRGALVAATLDGGRELWRVQLDADMATIPFYGFTASPLIWQDLLVLPTGGDYHAVTAFDKQTGKVRWTAESGLVAYQSVAAFELAGRPQLVAVANQWLAGLEPATGKTLWKHRFAEGNLQQESAHVTPAGANRLLLDLEETSIGLEITAGITGGAGALAAKEAYRTPAFANTLSLPVHHDGVLYGFTGRFLTALDAASGEILWRSRPPGGSGLALVDGKLAVLDSEGNLVLIEASREEYREIARVKALDGGNYAAPSFAGGHFFVRNQSQLAAVRPAAAPASAAGAPAASRAAAPPQELRGELGRLVARVRAAEAGRKQQLVDEYLAGVASTPILEPGLAHFVYRGKAEDVGVAGSFIAGENAGDRPLEKVEGTDLFFRSEALDDDGIWSYALVVDYGDPAPDPLNPSRLADGGETLSELRMPGAIPTPYLAEPAAGAPRGELDTFRWHDAALGSRRISVYLPPGYDASTDRYPVLVVNHGDRALRSGLYRNSLDQLIGQNKIAPLIAVFVPRAAGNEYGGPPADDYVRMLTEGLLPHLDRHYRTDPRNRATIGVGSAGLISAYAGLKAPQVFRQVAVQSFYVNGPIEAKLLELIEAGQAHPRFLIEVSRHDYDIPRAQIEAGPDARQLAAELRQRGGEVELLETAGEPGWARWRAHTGTILASLFPPPSP